MSSLYSRLLLSVALPVLALPFAAHAQTAAPPPGAAALDEVVVTARKTNETITQTPVSVSAFSAEALSQRGIKDYLDLARFSPGLNFQNQNVNRNDRGFQVFQTRGIALGTNVFIDGVAVAAGPSSAGTTGGINDIERIEIINGPQSATFGRASFGGAINFVTARPKFDFGAQIDVSAATRGVYELKGSVEGPLVSDVLAARLSVRAFEQGALFDNFSVGGGLGEQSTRAVAAAFLFTPSDRFDVYLRSAYWEDDDGPPAQAALNSADYNCATPTAVAGRLNYVCGEVSSAPRQRMVLGVNVPDRVIDYVTGQAGFGTWPVDGDFIDHFGLHREAQHHSLTWNYDLPVLGASLGGNLGYATDNWAFITDTSFQNGQLRPTPGAGMVPQPNPFYQNPAFASRPGFADLLPTFSRTAASVQVQKTKVAEIRATSSQDGPFKWLLGVNYIDNSLLTVTNAFNNDGFANPGLLTQTTSETYGAFGSVSYRFGFGLSLIAEGRVQRDRIQQRVMTTGGLNATGIFKSQTPRLIVQYEPTPNTNFYVSYAEGVRPGTFNGSLFSRDPRIIAYIQQFIAPGISELVPEETIQMYEIGFKGRMLDNRLTVMAAAYKANWLDRQTPQNISYPGTPAGDPRPLPVTTFTVIASSGKAELYGLELQAAYQVTQALRLEASFAYAETKNKFQNCTACLALIGNSNPVGTRFGLYPALTGALSASYERPAFADYTGYARVDYSYRGKIYADPTELTWSSPGHTVNLRLGARNDRYSFELFARNLFNEDAPTSLARNTDAFAATVNTLVVSPPDPRIFGARVTARY